MVESICTKWSQISLSTETRKMRGAHTRKCHLFTFAFVYSHATLILFAHYTREEIIVLVFEQADKITLTQPTNSTVNFKPT